MLLPVIESGNGQVHSVNKIPKENLLPNFVITKSNQNARIPFSSVLVDCCKQG
jgi:hypothetical protein